MWGGIDRDYNLSMAQPQIDRHSPADVMGTWRRFGLVGPVYQVIGEGDSLPNGDRLMRIRVVETGEEVDYSLTKVLDDPRET